MWLTRDKRPSSRRRDGLIPNPAEPRKLWKRFRAAGGIRAIAIILVTYSAIVAMDCLPLDPMPYRLNGYLSHDVYSRVPFEMVSLEQTALERERAAKKVPSVIRLDEEALGKIMTDLRTLPSRIRATTQPADDLLKRFDLGSNEELASFESFASSDRAAEYEERLNKMKALLLSRYPISAREYFAITSKENPNMVVAADSAQRTEPVHALLNLDSRDLDPFLLKVVEPLDPSIQRNVVQYLRQTAERGQGLFHLDAKATTAAEEIARQKVALVKEPFPAHKLLATRTIARGIAPGELELLAADHEAFDNQRSPARSLWIFAGRAGMIFAIVAFLILYVARHHGRDETSYTRGAGIAIVMVVLLGLTKVVIGLGEQNPALAVFSAFMAAVIFSIAYDQRFAFAVAGALVVLTVFQLRLSVSELVLLWSVTGATAFQLREVRTRSKLIEVGGITAIVGLLVLVAAEASAGKLPSFIAYDAIFVGLAIITAGFIAQGILPAIERAFRVATSLTLLEWCDANRPLLKRLALEAQGTYNHSLLLGTMCEAAAEAIGARGLLCRVGAYYHDIGKINKPQYFVENQLGPASLHAKLSPAMSLLIIKGHVKDGLEMAKAYGLPEVLREFITSHHGTTLVEYFYHAAAQQRRVDIDRAPDEVEFRYPGPKPRLKEVAILMMADASESSVRAMSEPSPGRIENQVHNVIYKRLMDGQMDDCDITLKEVHGVEASLVTSLCGLYHGRVRYPAQIRADHERADRLAHLAQHPQPPEAQAEVVGSAELAGAPTLVIPPSPAAQPVPPSPSEGPPSNLP